MHPSRPAMSCKESCHAGGSALSSQPLDPGPIAAEQNRRHSSAVPDEYGLRAAPVAPESHSKQPSSKLLVPLRTLLPPTSSAKPRIRHTVAAVLSKDLICQQRRSHTACSFHPATHRRTTRRK